MVSQYPPDLSRAHTLTTATPKAAFMVTIRHNRPNGLTATPHFHPLTHTRQPPRQPRTTSENAPLMVSMRLLNPRASAACACVIFEPRSAVVAFMRGKDVCGCQPLTFTVSHGSIPIER